MPWVRKAPQRLGRVGLPGDDGSALPRRDVLDRVERQDGQVRERPDGPAATGRTQRMGRVRDDRQAVTVGDRADRLVVGGLTGVVDGHEGPGPLGDRGLDAGRVDQAGARVDVDEDGRGAQVESRVRRRGEGHRRHHDLVARADARAA